MEPAPGQQFGERARQERALQSVNAAARSFTPDVVPLTAPTQRPEEPVTAGLARGAGPGPEVLTGRTAEDSVVAQLQGLYLAFPNEDLRRVVEIAQRRVRPSGEGAV